MTDVVTVTAIEKHQPIIACILRELTEIEKEFAQDSESNPIREAITALSDLFGVEPCVTPNENPRATIPMRAKSIASRMGTDRWLEALPLLNAYQQQDERLGEQRQHLKDWSFFESKKRRIFEDVMYTLERHGYLREY